MSFIFGGTTGETQGDITDARKRLALAMLQQGSDTSPIQSPWQGAARMLQAAMGGYDMYQMQQQQQDADAKDLALVTGQPYTPPAQSPGLFGSLFGGGKGVPAPDAQGQVAATNPSPASGSAADTSDLNGNQVYSGFMDTVKGSVKNPYALAAIASTGKAESGFSPQNAGSTWADGKNPAGGIMSWNGPRLANLQKFSGGGNGTPQQQAQFFLQENPQLIASLNNAKSVDEAQQLMNNAWAFKGYNVPGNANAANRLATARSMLPQFASAQPEQGGPQIASLDPSAGMQPPASPQNGPVDPAAIAAQLPQPAPTAPAAAYRDPMVSAVNAQPPMPPAAQAIQQQAPFPGPGGGMPMPAGPDPVQTASIGPNVPMPGNGGAVPTPQPRPDMPPQAQQPDPSADPRARLAAVMQNAPQGQPATQADPSKVQQLAQAMTSAPQAPNAMANPRVQALMKAMMNPNASPQMRQMVGAALQQEMSRGQTLYQAQVEQYVKQQDPMYQATLQKAQYELQHMGQVSPDTQATLQAQRDKMQFDADQATKLADHNQRLKENDPLQQANVAKTTVETANLANPRMSPAEKAAAELATRKEDFEEGKGITVNPGQTVVAPGGPNAGKVLYQGTGFTPSDVHDMRKEFESLPNYKSYQQAAPVYKSMVDTATTDSKASDLNLVYGLGKIMDPNSVVREGEMVMVNNTSSLPDWLQGAINSVNGGSRLEPATRTAILNEAKNRISSYRSVLDNDMNQYRGIAQRRGMNPDDILPVLSDIADVPKLDGSQQTGQPVQIKSVDDYNNLPKGTQYIDPNGVPRTKN